MPPFVDNKKSSFSHKKIYQPTNRINFLIDQQHEHLQPMEDIKPVAHPEAKNDFNRPAINPHPLVKIILIALVIVMVSGAMYFSEKLFSPSANPSLFNRYNPFARLAMLLLGSHNLSGEFSDRVNILILGIGGEGHDGPYLTDTIIMLSVKPSTGEIAFMSIPRDMVIQLNDKKWYKINSLYSMYRTTDPNRALDKTVQAYENMLQLPIQYHALVTFSGFEKFIDEIGGITVEVPNSFTDYTFPTDNYKVQTVSFTKGVQTMNGTTALNYARSRHGNNNEGSDYARSRRQQLILKAIKDKVLNAATLLNFNRLSSIADLLGNAVDTNLSIWQGIRLFNLVKNTDDAKTYHLTLDDSPDNLLIAATAPDGAWILEPKDGNYDKLAKEFDNIFNMGTLKTDSAQIELLNGTNTSGLAFWTKAYLDKLGYQISRYGNAPTLDYTKTIIYDLTHGQKQATVDFLKKELNATVITEAPPTNLIFKNAINPETNAYYAQPDLIAVLGTDFLNIFKLPTITTTPTSTAKTIATSTLEIIKTGN